MATGMLTESQLKEKLATPRSPPPIPQEPFTLTKPFIDTPFPYPDCALPLTKKTPNGFGVSTSQISTSHLGIRDKPVNPHTRAFDAAAAKQHATEIHYPSLRSCHLQANYPSTIVKLDPSYPVWKSNLRRVRPESPRRPLRHRRDTCSMAWRCRFLTASTGHTG
jgi:hypothetical protein